MKKKKESKAKYVILAVLTLITIAIIVVGVKKDKAMIANNEKAVNQINSDLDNDNNKKDDKSTSTNTIISCWGDALTFGAGGDGVNYPSELANLTNMTVYNYGFDGETTNLIAARQGGISLYAKKFTIPATKDAVEIILYDKLGSKYVFKNETNANTLNPCKINDIEGNITYNRDTKKMYFTRTSEGEEVKVKAGTQLFTNHMLNKDDKKDEVLVIFTGNDEKTDIDEIIKTQKKMIKYANTDKYIVIGVTKDDSLYENTVLKKEYGSHFLNIKKYLIQNGLKDANITATKQDKADVGNSIIPTSLRSEGINGNSTYYKLVAQQVFNKINELGYFK
ncbi:hypothetical protein [Intestinibacter bartlettii]|uniref:hypothetical protein n=1 Tax=Intestinibacter bartlettii TaxID=261299 RepID=UPI001D12EBD6|nr:hypothetical protein [Intestinibacter bartlettii]MCC2706182.1 hypothetical protein [Intestinibacter bartlettii]MCC2761632.1 hypothetical protein [Intestinibacter bartlettii]MDU6473342.1 hypothetical protein [Intestinibacter bartlettii]